MVSQESLLPIYSTQAGGEFGSCGFVVGDTGATMSVTRTVFRTWAIYVIMWTRHGDYSLVLFCPESNSGTMDKVHISSAIWFIATHSVRVT